MQPLHATSMNNVKRLLPLAVEIRALRKDRTVTDQHFARVDFSSAESSANICLGTYDHKAGKYTVLRIIRAEDGTDVAQERYSELQRLYLEEWPGVSSFIVRKSPSPFSPS